MINMTVHATGRKIRDTHRLLIVAMIISIETLDNTAHMRPLSGLAAITQRAL